MSAQIPFHKPSITQTEIEAVSAVLRSGWLTTGSKARELEAAVAKYVGRDAAGASVAPPEKKLRRVSPIPCAEAGAGK